MAEIVSIDPEDVDAPAPAAVDIKPEDVDVPRERTAGEEVRRRIGLGIRDVGMGAAAVPLMIGDAANAAINLPIRGLNYLTGSKVPTLPSASGATERFMTRAGLPEAESPGERVISDATRAAASVPGNVMTGGALAAARGVGQGVRAVGNALAAAPGTQMVSAVGSGAGSGIAKEEYPDNPVAALAGGLLGGITAPSVAAIAEGAKNVGAALLKPFYKGGQKQVVGDVLRRGSQTPETLDAQLDQRRTATVPGSEPTTAESLRDPAMAVLERGARQNTPGAAASFAEREAERAAARRAEVGTVEPGTGGAEAVAASVQQGRQRFQDATDAIIASARRKAEEGIALMGDDVSPEAAGAVMRQEFDRAYGEVRQRVSEAYRRIDPNGETAIPVQPLAVQVGETAQQFFGNAPSGIPSQLRPILETLAQGRQTPMTVAQLDGISKEAARIAGTARQAGDRPLAAAAQHIVDDVRNHIDDAAASLTGVSPETAQAMRDARTLRAEQGTRFEQGANKPLTKTVGFGEQAIPESAIPANYLRSGKGGAEAAQSYIQSMGGRPQAVAALRDHAATELRDYAARPDGTIDPVRWRRWMDDREGALSAFPDVRRDFRSAGDASAMVDRLVGRQTRLLEDFERSAAGYFLRKNPEDAVSAILNGSNSEAMMRQAVHQMRNDPAALSGLRRAVRDLAVKGAETSALDVADNPVMSTAKFVNFVKDNRKALSPLFTPDQMATMERVAADMQSQQWTLNAGRVAGSPTHQLGTTAGFIANVSNGAIDPSSPLWRGTGGRVLGWLYKIPDQQIQQLLADALLDPKIAKEMVAHASAPNVRSLGAILRDRAKAMGIGATTGAEASPDRSEPKPLAIEIRPPRVIPTAEAAPYADGGSVSDDDAETGRRGKTAAARRTASIPTNRDGLAGALGMPAWHEQSPVDIAMGFAGSTTPKVGKMIRAYHGSPHDFVAERLVRTPSGTQEFLAGKPDRLPDVPQGYESLRDYPLGRFREDKIGTGEGAQAYGHGVAYLAESEGVAKAYRDALAKDMYYAPSGKMFDPQAQLKHLNVRVAARNNGPDLDATIARAQELLPKASAQSRPMIEHDLAVLHSFRDAGGIAKNPGRMYEVDIHADPARFLDWDKPFAQQHRDVQEAINDLWKQKGGSLEGRTLPPFAASESLTTGESLYPAIATTYGKGGNARLQEAGSNALRERGIPGIKYLDQGSRAAGEGSRNYVVFDDGLIDILRKYGIVPPVAGAATSASDDAGAAGYADGGPVYGTDDDVPSYDPDDIDPVSRMRIKGAVAPSAAALADDAMQSQPWRPRVADAAGAFTGKNSRGHRGIIGTAIKLLGGR